MRRGPGMLFRAAVLCAAACLQVAGVGSGDSGAAPHGDAARLSALSPDTADTEDSAAYAAWLVPSLSDHNNTESPDTPSPDDSSDSNAITHCTRSTACRLGVLAGVVTCVAIGMCLMIRENKGKPRAHREGGVYSPAVLNTEEAHPIANYSAHEDLWPGPQEWKKLSVQQRGRVAAKVVKMTTSLLRGPDSARNSAVLNEWVRGEEGIFVRDVEAVKESLDSLIVTLDTSQAVCSQELGVPWPHQNRWRRISKRQKARIYATCIQGSLNHRNDIRKFAKWVKERGYLINQVEVAFQEAQETLSNIIANLPVAFSDVKQNFFSSRHTDTSSNLSLDSAGAESEGTSAWEGQSNPDPQETAPMLQADTFIRATKRHNNSPPPKQPATKVIPELSITVASVVTECDGAARLSKEDSLAVFAQYLETSPRLAPSEVGETPRQTTLSPASIPSRPPSRQWSPGSTAHMHKHHVSTESMPLDLETGHLPGLNDDVPPHLH